MRCKPGDLAITINAPKENGKLVDVIRIADLPAGRCIVSGPYWLVRSKGSPFTIEPGFRHEYAVWPDSMLMPIRDQPGADQSLDWAPVPAKREGVPA